jgi:hypothetical protein
MRATRRNRKSVRPDLCRAGLEDRLVLSLPPGYTFTTPAQVAQLGGALNRVLRSTEFGVRTQIQAAARQLLAGTTPTAQQVADFQADADGMIVAGTSSTANLLALLPGSQNRLLPGTVRALLSSNQNSLLSRVQNIVANTNDMSSSAALDTAIAQAVRNTFGTVQAQADQTFANENFNRAILYSTSGAESLAQFVGDRIVTQFSNNFGNLAVAFPSVANSVLFANGATTASAAAIQELNQMATPALASAAYTLGNELQLLPGGTTIIPALQTALFGTTTSTTNPTGTTGTTTGTPTGALGTRTTPLSLLDALQALPTTTTTTMDLAAALPTAFSTAFGNLANTLNQFLGTTPIPTMNLPTTTTAGVFSPTFTGNTFENGFLGGFGSGFAGFGMAPSTLNTNFGTGFNSFVSTANPALGFITPPIVVSTGSGTGVVGTIGVTTGSGAGSTGTGTTGTGTTATGTAGTGTTGSGTIA